MDIDKTKEQLISELVKVRKQSAELKALKVRERLEKHDLAERTKELKCFYKITRFAEREETTLDKAYQRIVNFLPVGWQYPDITCARITIYNKEFRTANYRETQWKQSADIVIHNKVVGRVEIYYLEERPVLYEGPFMKEERLLIDAIAERLGSLEEQKKTKLKLLEYRKKVRSLVSQLPLAEEGERKRISMEIHHNISQPLGICQIKIGELIKSASFPKIAKELNDIHIIINKLINDLRSMTFRISSPLLYEIGVEAALENLTEQMQDKHGIPFRFEGSGHPKPLYKDISIFIYQAVRELITNVVKHAQACQAKVKIKSDNNIICITVEDDGIGFDPRSLSRNFRKAKGFGLFSIRERIRHIGGQIEINSKEGNGTKIAIGIPVKQSMG